MNTAGKKIFKYSSVSLIVFGVVGIILWIIGLKAGSQIAAAIGVTESDGSLMRYGSIIEGIALSVMFLSVGIFGAKFNDKLEKASLCFAFAMCLNMFYCTSFGQSWNDNGGHLSILGIWHIAASIATGPFLGASIGAFMAANKVKQKS